MSCKCTYRFALIYKSKSIFELQARMSLFFNHVQQTIVGAHDDRLCGRGRAPRQEQRLQDPSTSDIGPMPNG